MLRNSLCASALGLRARFFAQGATRLLPTPVARRSVVQATMDRRPALPRQATAYRTTSAVPTHHLVHVSVEIARQPPPPAPTNQTVAPLSVNYFINRKCNYKCKFCFHTQKNTTMISLQEGLRGLQLLRDAGCDKMNFAGGEPFLHPRELGELCRGAAELGMAVSIISNASVIRR
jgi:sulfatase maturation enzyme AslB (radical SAM superfamily)